LFSNFFEVPSLRYGQGEKNSPTSSLDSINQKRENKFSFLVARKKKEGKIKNIRRKIFSFFLQRINLPL